MSELTLIDTKVDVSKMWPFFDMAPVDKHFPGRNRYRLMSRFSVEEDGSFLRIEPIPLFQSKTVNPLEGYGGYARDYGELPEGLVRSSEFRTVMDMWRGVIPEDIPRFSVHHIRTVAPGDPVPEGRHRDGYRWVGLYVARRENIDPVSGITTFWHRETEAVAFTRTIQAGELVVFNDRKFTHYTTPIKSAGDRAATRDVFIITTPDHGEITTEADETR